MKVILLQGVPGTGQANEIKEVSNGYAVNFLLPRQLAVVATAKTLANLKQQTDKQKHQALAKISQAKDLSARLNGKAVEIAARASPAGKLYAAVSPLEISQAIKKQYGAVVDGSDIILEEHLKTLGSHLVAIKLDGQEKVDFTVNLIKS
ncbi:MAG: 50S ribosomal protein L9 [Candidatus Kerfeldbacteria bacterium]|nr:50S ribosomal protein L9 [Candidatus Kerfeldbacteria bacterium]